MSCLQLVAHVATSNLLSPDAIIAKLRDVSNVSHVPDQLAHILASMLNRGEIECMEETITGVIRSACTCVERDRDTLRIRMYFMVEKGP